MNTLTIARCNNVETYIEEIRKRKEPLIILLKRWNDYQPYSGIDKPALSRDAIHKELTFLEYEEKAFIN